VWLCLCVSKDTKQEPNRICNGRNAENITKLHRERTTHTDFYKDFYPRFTTVQILLPACLTVGRKVFSITFFVSSRSKPCKQVALPPNSVFWEWLERRSVTIGLRASTSTYLRRGPRGYFRSECCTGGGKVHDSTAFELFLAPIH